MFRYDDRQDASGATADHGVPNLKNIDPGKFVDWLDALRTERNDEFREYVESMQFDFCDQLVEMLLKRAAGKPGPTREELIIVAIGLPAKHTLYVNITWKMPTMMRLTALRIFKTIAEQVDDENESKRMYLSLHTADDFVDKSCSVWPAIVQAAAEVRAKHLRRFKPVASTPSVNSPGGVQANTSRLSANAVISSSKPPSPPTASNRPAGVTISSASRCENADCGDDFDPKLPSRVFDGDAKHVERQGDQ